MREDTDMDAKPTGQTDAEIIQTYEEALPTLHLRYSQSEIGQMTQEYAHASLRQHRSVQEQRAAEKERQQPIDRTEGLSYKERVVAAWARLDAWLERDADKRTLEARRQEQEHDRGHER